MTITSAKPLEATFDERFMDDYLGSKMSSDAVTAVVELIANAWDAGAKTVKVTWPLEQDQPFVIADDGHGLTDQEFQERWRKLSYNRVETQGAWAEIPADNNITGKRAAYGRNGRGRYSAFCFGDNVYYVETRKGAEHFCYEVKRAQGKSPLAFDKRDLPPGSLLFHAKHGTAVFTFKSKHIGIPLDRIKSEVGLRFLTDPDFKVTINNQVVQFGDIDGGRTTTLTFMFKGEPVTIKVINTEKSDRTAQQHGVAWHVNHRLVGSCNWDGLRNDSILDGRTNVAKRFTFIVIADAIADAVKADWSGFDNSKDAVLEFYDGAKKTILDYITELSKEQRVETAKQLLEDNRQKLSVADATGVSRWKEFVDRVQVECPNLRDDELQSISKILANLEASTSKYSLVHQLSECTPKDLDDLSEILHDWNIKSAKAVLDEVQTRLRLIKDIRDKVHKMGTLEVQELQPLFGRGLWIFGPEFESIEYTSNVGMTKVLQDLFGLDTTGSLNRPDFVILPNTSIGLYGCYEYDDAGAEIGIKKVVIVELKRPGVALGSGEKEQCWKYVKELYEKGAILEHGSVDCYLLGETVEKGENSNRTDRDGSVIIRPLIYDTILKRAETRMLNLHKKIENAPFLQDSKEITEFLEKNTIAPNEQLTLADLEGV